MSESMDNLLPETRIAGNDLKKNGDIKNKVSLREKLHKLFSKETILSLEEEGRTFVSLMAFFGLVLIFLFDLLFRMIGKLPLLRILVKSSTQKAGKNGGRVIEKIISKLEAKPGRIRRSVLINLAFRNMKVKRTRAMVTVGGMGMGIGAIVFLVSLGYGVQRLVVGRVARLEELRMADVTMQNSSNLKLDGNAVTTMKNMPGVKEILPVVSLVGKVTFSGGQGESLVYGVTTRYMEAAGIKPIQGEYFNSEFTAGIPGQGIVAGASTDKVLEPGSIGESIQEGRYYLDESETIPVTIDPWLKSPSVGYTKAISGGYWGRETWGERFIGEKGKIGINKSGQTVGIWIYSAYPLWEKKDKGFVPQLDETGSQIWSKGYIPYTDQIQSGAKQKEAEPDLILGEVLGDSIDEVHEVLGEVAEATLAATVVGKDEAGVEWVDLSSLDATAAAKQAEIMMIETPEGAKKQAMVNESFLELIGIKPESAVGSTFDISFVILNTLKPDLDRPTQSKEAKYTISGVISEGNTPLMYVPLEDLTGLGITNYSQAKITVDKQEELKAVRQQVDNLGYRTASVADTVAQIDKLFATVRIVLASFGLVALTVASLGMFNTLTVSLMERTREVGVMKAMGMRSVEVKELFLAEAMIMGLLGGVFGVVAGYLMGKLLGVLLSTVSIIKGVGWIDVSYIPWQFIVFVLALSFVVGVATGIYPARRARKISALNALRYE